MRIEKRVEIAFHRHEEWAIDAVYTEAFPLLKWTAFSYLENEADAEDMAEEAIVNALEGYDPEKGQLLGYLLVVVKNLSVSLLRKRAKIEPGEEMALEEYGDEDSRIALLLSSIKEILGEKDYDLVISVLVFDVPLIDMASQFGENLSTVKSRYYRALKTLRKKLGKGGR